MRQFLILFFINISFWSCSKSPTILVETDGELVQISDSIEKIKSLKTLYHPTENVSKKK